VTRRETPLDPAAILHAFDRHGVEYVLIGGLAVQAHGHLRTTQDVDVFPSRERRNLERLAAALTELGARPAGTSRGGPPSARSLASAANHVLETDAGGLDVHLQPPGAGTWPAVRERAMVLEVVGVQVAVAGLDDVIAMKRAAGRPIDRGDILALTQPPESRPPRG
jgi:predicted nucleotidyltransferase